MSGVRGDAQRCQVRASVTFPGAGESAGSGVTVLADRSVTGERIDMELLVRGRHLSVGFTPSDGAGALTVPDGFGVALPQGALVAREVTADDATLWRVRLSADVPLRALPTCLQGPLGRPRVERRGRERGRHRHPLRRARHLRLTADA